MRTAIVPRGIAHQTDLGAQLAAILIVVEHVCQDTTRTRIVFRVWVIALLGPAWNITLSPATNVRKVVACSAAFQRCPRAVRHPGSASWVQAARTQKKEKGMRSHSALWLTALGARTRRPRRVPAWIANK